MQLLRLQISNVQKRQSSHQCFFLQPTQLKAACKTLMKLTPGDEEPHVDLDVEEDESGEGEDA